MANEIITVCEMCGQELKTAKIVSGGEKKYGFQIELRIMPCESCLKDAEEHMQKETQEEMLDEIAEDKEDIERMLRAYGRDF